MSTKPPEKMDNDRVEVLRSSDPDAAANEGRQKTTTLMFLFALYIGLAGWIYNFDLGYGGVVLIMVPFLRDFGTCVSAPDASGVVRETCALSALELSSISFTFLFVALGGLLAGVTGHYLGRRGTIQVGCLIVAIGAGGMLGTAGNFTAYVACKCIGGVGLGHFIAGAPSYGVECVAPGKRGMLTALFNIGLAFGNTTAIAVCLGSSHYATRLAWQVPIICQIPLALILGVGVSMFPESPRWLLVKGKEDAARRSFARFYNLDSLDPEITRQVREVQYYIELEKANESTSGWTEIFHSKDRTRTLTSLLIVIAVAITGGKFVSAYAAVFLADVGISNTFLINVVVAACSLAGSVPAPLIVEYGGRRLSLLIGYALLCSLHVDNWGGQHRLGLRQPSFQNRPDCFSMPVVFVYSACIGTSISTTAPEMHSVRLRTMGHAFASCTYEVFSFAAAFYTPYMLSADYGNMGTNVGYFYFGVTAVVWVLIFAFVPETARLTLEQIDDYFMSGEKAWKTSITRNKKVQEHAPVDIYDKIADL